MCLRLSLSPLSHRVGQRGGMAGCVSGSPSVVNCSISSSAPSSALVSSLSVEVSAGMAERWLHTQRRHGGYYCMLGWPRGGYIHSADTVDIIVCWGGRGVVTYTAPTRWILLYAGVAEGWLHTQRRHGGYYCMLGWPRGGYIHSADTVDIIVCWGGREVVIINAAQGLRPEAIFCSRLKHP